MDVAHSISSAPPSVSSDLSNGTASKTNGIIPNGDANGDVVTNAPGMSAGSFHDQNTTHPVNQQLLQMK